MKNIVNYIMENWDKCIKRTMNDDGELIGLPYPYTCPAVGHFNSLFYWDTYFTNKGLELSNRHELAKSNVDNMLYLVDRYGFMPNGNRTYFLTNSQPPFLSEMVKDIYEYYKDTVWLRSAYSVLEKEYSFWMKERISPIGLNSYGGSLVLEEKIEYFSNAYRERTGDTSNKSRMDMARHSIASGESGWDMTPRWGNEAYDYVQIDLNSLMYQFEKNMGYFASILKNNSESLWNERANHRKSLIMKYMRNTDGILTDYNFTENEHSKVLTVASLYPLYVGMVDDDYATLMEEQLSHLETDYGVVTCEKIDDNRTFQWGYPNGWACLQYIAIMGFDRYGHIETARRLATKYVTLADKVFDETGNLWEKYNVIEGNVKVCEDGEYKMPPMMGWSAGVYLAALNYINGL